MISLRIKPLASRTAFDARRLVLERQQCRPQQVRLRIGRRHPPLELRAAGAAGPEAVALRRERIRIPAELAARPVRQDEAAERGVDASHRPTRLDPGSLEYEHPADNQADCKQSRPTEGLLEYQEPDEHDDDRGYAADHD
jgi:hypothetical protein